jgi:hypothetical protein
MKARKSKAVAYFSGHMPTIACINHASVDLGVDFDALIDALQVFVTDHVAPAWGTPAKLIKANGYHAGCWAMIFLDHADHAKALAYHDLTPDGFPQSKVFVKTTRDDGTPVSMAASHELVEMLVDPSMNLEVMKPDGKVVHRYEAADPVQDLRFPVNGIPMTNFVYPAYFESFHKPGSVRFDHMKKLNRPFQIHIHGYQSVYVNRKWTMRFGSRAQQRKYEREDRRGRRLERRAATKRRRSAKTHALRPTGRT